MLVLALCSAIHSASMLQLTVYTSSFCITDDSSHHWTDVTFCCLVLVYTRVVAMKVSVLQPDIPHIDEHVSKVECIGVKTQQKLLDIKAAAATVGIQDLNVIHNTITTGG